jgi:ethanolamine-phosphate cytidylyltransferase
LISHQQRGDYLIVGIHGDALVNRERGCNLPLMNLHERVLSVLGCRHVDDVLIDAPRQITHEMIQSLGIQEVVNGKDEDHFNQHIDEKSDPYRYAKEAGIYVEIIPPSKFNLAKIVSRIQANQTAFQEKIARKKKAENDFYNTKYNRKSLAVPAE